MVLVISNAVDAPGDMETPVKLCHADPNHQSAVRKVSAELDHVLSHQLWIDTWVQVGESPATHGRGASRGNIASAGGLCADELLDVSSSVVRAHACGEVAVGALELHRGDGSGAVEGDELGARGLAATLGLAGGVGHELLLVDIHLPLDLRVLLLVGSG